MTAGVAGILVATLTVSVALRQFLHGAKEAATAVNALICDVKALRKVFESLSMKWTVIDWRQAMLALIGQTSPRRFRTVKVAFSG
jgi:P2-related tail formation protein